MINYLRSLWPALCINCFVPGKCGCGFDCVIFKHFSVTIKVTINQQWFLWYYDVVRQANTVWFIFILINHKQWLISVVYAYRLFTSYQFCIQMVACFLAATKQLYEWFSPSVRLSVCLSVRLSHLFDYVPIIISSWNFQELLPVTKVTSMQKVKVRGQRSRSQRSQPHLTVSGL